MMDKYEVLKRPSALPFTCVNPRCGFQIEAESFVDSIWNFGLAMADCGEMVYQGVSCPRCGQTTVKRFPRKSLLVNPEKFIAAPVLDPFQNLVEQVEGGMEANASTAPLGFKWIPAWDKNEVPQRLLFEYIQRHRKTRPAIFPPVVMTQEEVERRLQKENQPVTFDGVIQEGIFEFHLRRFFPDIPKFKNILTILAPGKARFSEFHEGLSFEKNTAEERQEEQRNWVDLFNEVWGENILKSVQDRLQVETIEPIESDIIEKTATKQIISAIGEETLDECKSRLSFLCGWKDLVWHLRQRAPLIVESVCAEVQTSIDVRRTRSELSSWVEDVIPGCALFIDAPMGLGKSHSIKTALTENMDLSAIVFMPTNRLCKEMVLHLKVLISLKKGYSWVDYKDRVNETDYLSDQVYYADGINSDECIHYEAIIKRYKANWMSKVDFCQECKKISTCRFIKHGDKIPKARIVITTHKQYDRFYDDSDLQLYARKDDSGQVKRIQRDLFIVDEDLLLSNCYQPIELTFDELSKTCSEISIHLIEEGEEDVVPLLESLIGKVNLCRTTSIIPPIEPQFRFSEVLKKDWPNSIPSIADLVPDRSQEQDFVGNHLDVIENAINKGFTVQRYAQSYVKDADGTEEYIDVKKVYLPNPKQYDLGQLPPHVFFDGTMIDETLVKHKLLNIEIKTKKYNLEKRFQYRVFQNEYTDLPKRKLDSNQSIAKEILNDILGRINDEDGVFIISSKALRDAFVEEYVEKEFGGREIVIEHYRNLRGLNSAGQCKVCIMLGSFIPSDAVEIAMAIDFIQDVLQKERWPIKTKDRVWAFRTEKFVRKYNADFGIVQTVADALRHGEQRQALARTRYIYHNVDFFIFSKDRISDYEPFFRGVEVHPYREDLFKPMPKYKHPDSKNEAVEKAVMEWLETNATVTAMEIHRKYGIRRQTVGKHLKEMLAAGKLMLATKTKYARRFPH